MADDETTWTLSELVAEVAAALERVPAPDNGQVRAVPDERGIRYYTTLGLLDRPAAMRGRTALYDRRHLAQVVAIKRMQTAGKTLAEIQHVLSSIDDATLARMSGVALAPAKRESRASFWRREPGAVAEAAARPRPQPQPQPQPSPSPSPPITIPIAPGIELRIDPAVADLRPLLAALSSLSTTNPPIKDVTR
jgi:DNA-binding transcriptional MerR regulator